MCQNFGSVHISIASISKLTAWEEFYFLFQSVRDDLEKNSERIEYLNKAAEYLMQKCEPADAETISQNMEEFRRLHESVLDLIGQFDQGQASSDRLNLVSWDFHFL